MATLDDLAASERGVESLFVQIRQPLSRFFASRLKHRQDIDDLVQDVFIRLMQRGHLTDIVNIDRYAFEIAKNVLNDQLRDRLLRRSNAHLPFEEKHAAEVEFGPDQILIDREQWQSVLSAIREMPERTRSILLLRRLEGLSYKAIAAQMGISVSGVEKHMIRAMVHLANRFGDDG